MRTQFLWSLLILMVTVAVGCKGQSPTQAQLLLIDPLDAQTFGYSIKWAGDIEVPRGRIIKYLVVLDDLIISVEAPTNLVTAISLRDGSLKWRQLVGNRYDLLFEPFLYKDTVVINSNNDIYRLDRESGKMRRIDRLRYVVNNAPAVVGDYAIYGSTTGLVFAQDLISGQVRWSYQLSDGIHVRPVSSAEQYVFAADAGGIYAMFDAGSGELLWRGRAFAGVRAQPVISQLSVLIPSEDHSLYALNKTDERDQWIHRETVPLTEDPTLISNTLYLPVPNQGVAAIDVIRGGRVLWRLEEDYKPIMQRDEVLFMHDRRGVVLVDHETGTIRRRIDTERLRFVRNVPDEDGLILVSPRGRVVRIDPL